jgi:hypothetical protein
MALIYATEIPSVIMIYVKVEMKSGIFKGHMDFEDSALAMTSLSQCPPIIVA